MNYYIFNYIIYYNNYDYYLIFKNIVFKFFNEKFCEIYFKNYIANYCWTNTLSAEAQVTILVRRSIVLKYGRMTAYVVCLCLCGVMPHA
jgi:hypothetical protein